MPRSSGTYTAPSSSVNPAVEGTVIDETDFNALVDDVETALNESVYTSGLGSTDNRLVRTDGTDTKKVQGSSATMDDDGSVFLPDAAYFVKGHTSALAHASGSTAGIQSHATDAKAANSLWRWSADTAAATMQFVKSRGAAVNTNTIVGSTDVLGQIIARGADGTGYIPAANISFQIDGTPGTNDMPGLIRFQTTADGAAAVTERMRITSAGFIGMATNAPLHVLDVNDDSVRVRTSQTPASAAATGNQGEICWDSDYIYVCVATNTWKRVAIATW